MAGIGIITNPHSKLNKRNPAIPQLLGYIAGEQGILKVTQNLEELDYVAQEFFSKKIDILAINGGDGTISRTISAFIKVYGETPLPAIATLRGGTMNMLAENLGIKGNPETLLFKLLTAHSTANPLPFRVLNSLQIEGHYGFLFANGTSFRFLQQFYKNKTGALGATALIVKLFISFIFNKKFFQKIVKSEFFNLRVDTKTNIETQSCSVFCSSVDKLPLGIRLFPFTMEANNVFKCVSISMSVEVLLLKLLFLALFPGSQHKNILSFFCGELEITSAKNGPESYTLDGELYVSENNKNKISLGPKIKFILL